MANGTVKWFNKEKGFGFISPDDSDKKPDGKDVFVHITALQKAGLDGLREGEKVTYDLEQDQATPERFSARNLKILNT